MMQPSSKSGNMTRLALMPISWIVAFFVVAAFTLCISSILELTIRDILRDTGHLPLLFILPTLFLGKVVGLMVSNLFAYAITPVRKVFEAESNATGRHSFAKAMTRLSTLSLILLLVAVAASGLYIYLILKLN